MLHRENTVREAAESTETIAFLTAITAIAKLPTLQLLERMSLRIMQSYALTEIRDRQHELLKQANTEPILLTEGSQPGYVILSAHHYQQLVDRLALLEDCALGQLAQTASTQSQMVGTEVFVAELQQIAHADSNAA